MSLQVPESIDSLGGGGDGLRVLVLLSTARDSAAAASVLRRDGIAVEEVKDLSELVRLVSSDAGAILLAERALADPAFDGLLSALEGQPAWSDLPVVLTLRSEVSSRITFIYRRLTNVTLLDRPTSVRTLSSAIHAALRARRRQYEIRARISALEEAERALRESDRRKDTFLATLAHELRNPLTPIRNAVQLLGRPAVAPELVSRLTEMIDRQSRTMTLLLDDLLDIARVTSGKLVLRPVDVTLKAVVDAAVEAARPVIEGKRHFLRLRVDEPGLVLRVDALRLSQVLTNLLTNAAKYTDPEGRIELHAHVDAGQVVFLVRDNGVGLDAALLPKIFEMFEQVEDTLNRSQGGLGIGLALSRSLVEMHGGTIRASSAGKGLGSTFEVRAPVAVGGEDELCGDDGTPGEAGTGALRNLTVVDDNVDAANSLALMLESEGYAVSVFHDAASVLAHADQAPPSTMLLDIGMPGMNGYQLASLVRSRAWGKAAVLVAITGWGQPDDRRLAADAGFDAHMTKPVALDALMATLARLRK